MVIAVFNSKGRTGGWFDGDEVFSGGGRPLGFIQGMNVFTYTGRYAGRWESATSETGQVGQLRSFKGRSMGR